MGLLRYLTSIHSWTASKVGQRREGSYAISNLVSFHPSGTVDRCAVKGMVFCTSADVVGQPPIDFNVVSVAEGPMDIAVKWQIGALDMGEEEDEIQFVEALCESIKNGFARLAKSGS